MHSLNLEIFLMIIGKRYKDDRVEKVIDFKAFIVCHSSGFYQEEGEDERRKEKKKFKERIVALFGG